MPNLDAVAHLVRSTELLAGAVLVVSALEVARPRLSSPFGAQQGCDPLVALVSAAAALVLGGLSLSLFLLQGGRLPSVNPNLAFAIAIELLIVPLAAGVDWLEFGRLLALHSTPSRRAQVSAAGRENEQPYSRLERISG